MTLAAGNTRMFRRAICAQFCGGDSVVSKFVGLVVRLCTQMKCQESLSKRVTVNLKLPLPLDKNCLCRDDHIQSVKRHGRAL
jgi:hypothetical protein